ncbi:MAG: prepilin-type N-terminal cleavage/methylation domain-containing protein [Gemmataceae bacterium]|nr:prepilin-type N-terminal cleavage/methylation domain-containing protein [Gemmataceae bacterium]
MLARTRPARPPACQARQVRTTRKGLTLIEVLLALTIMLLALGALGRLVDLGSARGSDARAHSRGARLAQSKMAEVEAGAVPVTGGASGMFEGDDAGWSFDVNSDPTGPPNLYTVTVTVSRTNQGRELQVVLTQLVFDPTKTGSAAQAQVSAADAATTNMTGGTQP